MNGPVRVADSQPRLHAHKAPSENRTRIFCMASRWVTTTPWAQNASLPNCQRSKMPRHQEHRAGIEPASPRYDGGVLPLDHQCQFQNVSVGPVRIELTSFGLRDRCITLSATIPSTVAASFQSLFRFSRCFVSVVVSFQSAWRELNPRPSPYKDAALTPELHADA